MTDTAVNAQSQLKPLSAIVSNSKVWVAVIAVATVCFYLSGPLGPDVSWLITVSERILAGQTLYVDILEPNPPVAGYLYMLPVWLAQLLGVPPEPLVIAYTVAAGLLSSGVTVRLVRRYTLLKRAELLWPMAFLLIGSAWGEDFAQREHFVTMAALPLFVAIALRAQGTRPRLWHWILAGLCGGFILAVKPHFAFAILLPVLYAALRRRSLRPLVGAPELWLAGSLFVAFLAMIWFFFPGFAANILPAAAPTYVLDRRDMIVLLSQPFVMFFLVLLAASIAGYRHNIGANPLLGTIFFGAIGFAIAFFAQGRGYIYQMMPAITLIGLFFVMSFAENADGRRRTVETAIATLCALVLAGIPLLNDLYAWKVRAPLYAAIEPYGPNLKIVNILPDLTAGSPLHRMVHGTLVNSPPGLLMTMSVLRLRMERQPTGEWAAAIDAVENGERTRLRQDMQKQPPDIIVTSATSYDWFDWAKQDPQIAAMVAGYEDFAVVPYQGYDIRLLRRAGLKPIR